MDKDEVVKQLQFLGMDTKDAKALLLVPLVQVAWADDDMVAAEVTALRDAATQFKVTDEGNRRLDGWIRNPPTQDYVSRAITVIREIAPHNVGLGADISREDLVYMLSQAQAVASAGTGLMGFFRTAPNEKRILADLNNILHPDAIDWNNVVEWDEDEEEDDEDEWEDEDSDEWEDDDSDDEDQPAGGLRLGIGKVKLSADAAEKIKKITANPSKKRRVAPKMGAAGKGASAGFKTKLPGFDDT